nr:MAG TPA: hypothetical protein [Caudoviricetes sp.]
MQILFLWHTFVCCMYEIFFQSLKNGGGCCLYIYVSCISNIYY